MGVPLLLNRRWSCLHCGVIFEEKQEVFSAWILFLFLLVTLQFESYFFGLNIILSKILLKYQ